MSRPADQGRRLAPDDPRHGTNAGAVAHWRAGEPPCEPCRRAARRVRIQCEVDRLAGQPRTVPLGDAHQVIIRVPRKQLSDATGLTVRKLSSLAAAGPDKTVHGHHSKSHAHDVAREHAKRCTGDQGDLLELLEQGPREAS